MKARCLLLLFALFSAGLYAQQVITNAGLARVVKQQAVLQRELPIEKLYLQTDKPFYAVGDTIWFKAYLFNAGYLKYSPQSGLLYVELANDSAEVVKRLMLPVNYGISLGQIGIDGKDIPQGNYTLRAYTNWQRNFGEDYIFSKNIYITGRENQPWLVKVHSNSILDNDKQQVTAWLALNDAANPLRLQNMQLRVKNGNKTLFKGQAQTDMAGTMAINFNLPVNTSTTNLNIEATAAEKKENIPLVVNRPEYTDLQFMPEGGSLVAGITTKVAFKAISEDGRGINVSGKVYNSKRQQIAAFNSAYKGMGSFIINPKLNETYTAEVNLPTGQTKSYLLPQVKAGGTVMNVFSTTIPPATATKTDSIKIRLTATKAGTYYLIGQSRGVMCYAQPVKLETYAKIITLPQSLFLTGVSRFSLLDQQGMPLNERIVYIDHHDNLKIAIQTNKSTYTARDSVALHIEITNKDDQPIQGNFSLAITDDGQVPADTFTNNLTASLLLTSDLKGTVEAPRYYLQDTPNSKQALDNLLLTQGWIGYNWQQVTTPLQQPQYVAEPEFDIKGRVTNMMGKSIDQANIILIAKNSPIPKFGKADANGEFIFNGLPVTDTAQYFLKATNKKGNALGMAITLNQITPPQFGISKIRYLPWYINTDTAMERSISQSISNRLEQEKITGEHVLKQVEIRAKKVIKGSHNLNGPGEADQVLDEKEIEKVGVATLAELLELKVKRLRVNGDKGYVIDKSVVHFVIDGKDLETIWRMSPPPRFMPPSIARYEFMKSYINSYPANEIIGIEVMTSSILTDEYDWESEPGHPKINNSVIKMNPPFAYIEITTRTGVGPYRQVSPGTLIYKPVQWGIAKQFYSPRYIVKNPNDIPDQRSTIYWEPLVITNAQGKATVSFYTADHPGNYTVVIEGSDMDGSIGSFTQKLNLTAK